jgi:hypothetical protein
VEVGAEVPFGEGVAVGAEGSTGSLGLGLAGSLVGSGEAGDSVGSGGSPLPPGTSPDVVTLVVARGLELTVAPPQAPAVSTAHTISAMGRSFVGRIIDFSDLTQLRDGPEPPRDDR